MTSRIDTHGRYGDDLARIIARCVDETAVAVGVGVATDVVWRFVATAPLGRHVVVAQGRVANDLAAKFPFVRVASEIELPPAIGLLVVDVDLAPILAALDRCKPPIVFRSTDVRADMARLSERGYVVCGLHSYGKGRAPLDSATLRRLVENGVDGCFVAYIPRRFERPRQIVDRIVAVARNPGPALRRRLAGFRNRFRG